MSVNRIIRNIEELNALPPETVLLAENYAYQKQLNQYGHELWDSTFGDGASIAPNTIPLPARIIHYGTPLTEQQKTEYERKRKAYLDRRATHHARNHHRSK